MMSFNKIYFTLFLVIFLIEILIAKYATGFLRHTIGDYLAVMFVYTFIKSIFKISIEKAVLITFTISFIIEFLQLSNLQNWYPSEYTKTFKLILGTSFSVGDLVAYTLGIGTIILIEKSFKKDRNEKAI
jgi:hypothetical protein